MTGHMLTHIMSTMGRNGDNMVGHLSHGDVVIPREIVLQNPEFLTKFKKAMQDNNQDYRGHIAGSGYENKNPHTGAPEFFLSGLFSGINKVVNNPMPTISGAMTGAQVGGPWGALVGGGIGALTTMNKPLAGSDKPAVSIAAPVSDNSQPFAAKRPDAGTQPFDLFSSSVGGQQFSTLDPMQQRSYLATQGTSGGGIGDEAKNYYLNLLQRNLIDENGQQQNINTSLLPVERNYLSRLGLPTDSTPDFFKALQG